MRIAENWKDYKIIDTSSGDKLESWGGKVLVRPDPQIIWKSPKRSANKQTQKSARTLNVRALHLV